MNSPLWKAGVAKAVITPGEPMWLAGWAARREPAAGKSQDLFAKALALEVSAGRRAIFLTADLIAIPRELAAVVAGRVQSRRGIDRKRILFNASHTHCGPELRADKVPFFEIPPEFAAKMPAYLRSLEDKMTGVIETALDNLVPVELRVSQTSAGFARNRRSPDGPVAHAVPVLQVLRPNMTPLAIVFGYACHNLTLPPSFCQYQGDYAGVAGQALEESFPGTTVLFLTGAGADQDPAPRGTLELTIEHGQALARTVAQTIGKASRPVGGTLAVAFDEVPLEFLPPPSPRALEEDLRSNDPPRIRKAKYLLEMRAANLPFPSAYPCPVQLFRFGNELLLAALGGEPVLEYDALLTREFAGPLVWVAGYSNDMFGYLPTRRVQQKGGYEGGRALLWSALPGPFTETVEDRILAAVRRLAAGLDIAAANR